MTAPYIPKTLEFKVDFKQNSKIVSNFKRIRPRVNFDSESYSTKMENPYLNYTNIEEKTQNTNSYTNLNISKNSMGNTYTSMAKNQMLFET